MPRAKAAGCPSAKPKRKTKPKAPTPPSYKNLAGFCLTQTLDVPWAPPGGTVSYWSVNGRTQYILTHAGREWWAASLEQLEALWRG